MAIAHFLVKSTPAMLKSMICLRAYQMGIYV